MKKYISVIEGDGIGPEVVQQTLKILDTIALKYNHKFYYQMNIAGGKSIEKFDQPIPEKTIKNCLKSNAVLLGCIGDPKYDDYPIPMRPESGLLALRKKMDLYCNVRPVMIFSNMDISPIKKERISNTDFIIYRELTSGIYFGKKWRSKNRQQAYDCCFYSKKEIKRIAHLAFKAAINRKKKVTLVDKSNVLETSRLWRDTVKEISLYYPEVKLDFLYVDNAAMQIIVNPNKFDIILTENMFGDILSDESSVISGSIGLLPSSSISFKGPSLFEPVHGSYPQAKNKNIANPIGCILSAWMMLDYFGMISERDLLKEAVENSILCGICTKDILPNNPSTTENVGNHIKDYIKDKIFQQYSF